MPTWRTVRPYRVLDVDSETRPLNYVSQDFTFSEITAIAWAWPPSRGAHAVCLGEPGEEGAATMNVRWMLEIFLMAWEAADIVTGHNIIRHDLPILNGACLENGLGPLSPKMVCDTYLHLKRKKGVGGSQANLAHMLGIRQHKKGMSQADWREANRLEPQGIEKTRKRVVGDVQQHVALRKELLRRQWLHEPRLWRP